MSDSSTLINCPIIDQARSLVDDGLDRFSKFGPGCPPQLEECVRYSLLAPGKRLRPVLTLLACHCCGGELEDAVPAACSVEMIHAYSLIHDDLPAMDDDELRRGRPTNHVVYGEANAILAGDCLIARAFEILAQEIQPASVAASCCAALAKTAGATELVGGQFDDLACQSQPGDRESLEAIHRRKTAALLRTSLRLGGLVANASEEMLERLKRYGDHLGLAFQITDDLLDQRGDESSLGKKTGMDEQRGKLTYPALMGAEESERLARQLVNDACEEIGTFGPRAEGLDLIARYVLERSS